MTREERSLLERKATMESQERVDFDPDRNERIVISFRGESGRGDVKHTMEFSLPTRLSLVFHWWMMTKGIVRA